MSDPLYCVYSISCLLYSQGGQFGCIASESYSHEGDGRTVYKLVRIAQATPRLMCSLIAKEVRPRSSSSLRFKICVHRRLMQSPIFCLDKLHFLPARVEELKLPSYFFQLF